MRQLILLFLFSISVLADIDLSSFQDCAVNCVGAELDDLGCDDLDCACGQQDELKLLLDHCFDSSCSVADAMTEFIRMCPEDTSSSSSIASGITPTQFLSTTTITTSSRGTITRTLYPASTTSQRTRTASTDASETNESSQQTGIASADSQETEKPPGTEEPSSTEGTVATATTSPDTNEDANASSSKRLAIGLGAGLGVAMFIILGGLGAWMLRRRRKRRSNVAAWAGDSPDNCEDTQNRVSELPGTESTGLDDGKLVSELPVGTEQGRYELAGDEGRAEQGERGKNNRGEEVRSELPG
ncbi:hypothetical protein MKZ38_008329 [Zalerion maritima]|uniref:Extracellular membrane protein CFEM domain-containing protein n=1 Tax=Zalerion maritima TaxID=339359 RepID=A0AAD5RL05_9PEZI|nr:hypothetical protein MKZ38_008329 [Zalerion maritima]